MVVAEFSDLFKKYRPDYHPSVEHMMTFSGPALMDTMSNEFPNQDPEKMCEEFTRLNPSYLEKYCKFYPYVKEMLDDLRRLGVHFAIVTNKERPQTNHCCKLFPLLSEFDTIITSTDIDAIKPDVIYSSVVHDGHGYIHCAHGMIPVPVPATSEIFAKRHATLKQIDIDTELVTPTGAAIISELAESFGLMPEMTVERLGWGSGTKNLKIPNILRVSYGEMDKKKRM